MDEEDRLLDLSDKEVRKIANFLLSEIDSIAKELEVEVPTGGNCVHAIRKLKRLVDPEYRYDLLPNDCINQKDM